MGIRKAPFMNVFSFIFFNSFSVRFNVIIHNLFFGLLQLILNSLFDLVLTQNECNWNNQTIRSIKTFNIWSKWNLPLFYASISNTNRCKMQTKRILIWIHLDKTYAIHIYYAITIISESNYLVNEYWLAAISARNRNKTRNAIGTLIQLVKTWVGFTRFHQVILFD